MHRTNAIKQCQLGHRRDLCSMLASARFQSLALWSGANVDLLQGSFWALFLRPPLQQMVFASVVSQKCVDTVHCILRRRFASAWLPWRQLCRRIRLHMHRVDGAILDLFETATVCFDAGGGKRWLNAKLSLTEILKIAACSFCHP